MSIYEQRAQRAQQVMAQQGIDWLFVSHSTDLLYLIGFTKQPSERLALLMIPRESRAGEEHFDTAPLPAVATRPRQLVVTRPRQRIVPPLPRNRVRAHERPTIHHNASTSTGADDDTKNDAGTGRGV